MSDPDRVAAILRQDARTCACLGVDFLPVRPAPPIEVDDRAPPRESEREDPPIVRTRSIEPTRPIEGARQAGPPTRPVTTEPSASAPEPVTPSTRPSAPAAMLRAGEDRASRRLALDALRLRYERDAPHKHFVTAHTRIVFDDGDPCADLMFIGEAPGADEDREGVPFVGKAGQLLNKMIDAMGLSRERVYIANVLKTRPPGNATPTNEEARACAPYLYGQVAIVRPRVIVTLGLPATRLILDSNDAMGRLRGSWRSFHVPKGFDPEIIPPDAVGSEIAVMPTYHPAFLLRSYTRENREKVWSDLQQVMARLGISPSHDA